VKLEVIKMCEFQSVTIIYSDDGTQHRLAYSPNCCCGRILLGYLATSRAKSDFIFSLGDPDFL